MGLSLQYLCMNVAHPLEALTSVVTHTILEVHGGATAAVCDELFGTVYDSLGAGRGFTANLSVRVYGTQILYLSSLTLELQKVNYRRPIVGDSELIIQGWINKVEFCTLYHSFIEYLLFT